MILVPGRAYRGFENQVITHTKRDRHQNNLTVLPPFLTNCQA